jgi:hypothetical protein
VDPSQTCNLLAPVGGVSSHTNEPGCTSLDDEGRVKLSAWTGAQRMTACPQHAFCVQLDPRYFNIRLKIAVAKFHGVRGVFVDPNDLFRRIDDYIVRKIWHTHN